ncbi:MAG: shikimate dehydrogenase [Propionibacteriaceae bacterium]|jgi:shikimate dehydrogenase|nr:shikimate dehydrogenase [Propionibacteriaceae bacterium]
MATPPGAPESDLAGEQYRRCAVIGSPISHSLSPVIHQAAYDWLGLDWVYDRHEVTAEGVASFVAGLDRRWRGLSVTMPCKQAIVELGQPDDVVVALGVANTVIFDGDPGFRSTTRVVNTDVTGVELVLGRAGVGANDDLVVFGNGATARSCVYAAARLGLGTVRVFGRAVATSARLARDAAGWGIEVQPITSDPTVDAVSASDFDGATVISTVPAAVALRWLPPESTPSLVFDVLYDPWPTGLVSRAARRGIAVATGLDLLAAQAVGQVATMTGSHVPFAVLRQAGARALGLSGDDQ